MRLATSSTARVATPAARPQRDQARVRRRAQTWRELKRSWQLYVMLLMPVLYLLVFHYWPMYGVQIAFRNFNVVDGITGSPWVGLAHFERFVTSYSFWQIIKNTVLLSVYSLAAGFSVTILLVFYLEYVWSDWFMCSVH